MISEKNLKERCMKCSELYYIGSSLEPTEVACRMVFFKKVNRFDSFLKNKDFEVPIECPWKLEFMIEAEV